MALRSLSPGLFRALAPRLPPLAPLSWWRALVGFVVAFTLPALPLALRAKLPGLVADPLLLTSAGTTLVALTYIALVRVTEWRRVVELGLRALPREFGIGIALGFIACMLILAGDIVLDAIAGGLAQDPAPAPDGRAIAKAFVSSRQFAFIEEIAFRGLLMRWLLGITRARSAVAIQALIFGLAHYPAGGWPHVLLATTMGFALGWAFLWRRSLWAPIAIHFAWDLFALIPGPAISTTVIAPAWLEPAEMGVAMIAALCLAVACRYFAQLHAAPANTVVTG
jgi:membrane protease YdiL (CAAX protease family)